MGWRSLVESYIYGDVRLHVHVRHGRDKSDRPRATDFCLTYEWPRGALGHDLELMLRQTWEAFYKEHVVKLDGRIDQMKVAMLVDVPEFLEHGEGFTIGRVLPCLKRLQRLEQCDECGIDGPELLGRGGLPVISALDDGEGDVAPAVLGRGGVRRVTGVVLTQGEDKLVERGAESVHDIPDDRPPHTRGRWLGRLCVDDCGRHVLAHHVWLHVNAVSLVRKVSDETSQRVNVFVRPVSLGLRI